MAYSPYRGGMPTDFNQFGKNAGGGIQNYGPSGKYGSNSDYDYSPVAYQRYQDINKQYGSDPDVAGALRSGWELQNPNAGTNSAEQTALLNMYKSRIGIKNSLAEQIANNGNQLQSEKDSLNLEAGRALDQGVRGARQNYNRRGLLYSGMREGAEQGARGAVAGAYASGMAGAERESANSLEAAKSAYDQVDLATQQEALTRANQAFDTASANNIARLQAMQQLGYGLGRVGGLVAGSYSGSGKSSYDESSKPDYHLPTTGQSYYDMPANNMNYDPSLRTG